MAMASFETFMAFMCNNSQYANDSTVFSRRPPGPYPFQRTGPKKAFEVKAVKEGLFARVDMPGVGEYQVDVFVKDNTVFFKGEARNEYADDPRTYLGCLDLSLHPDKIGDIRTEMKDGVLRILAPPVFTQLLPAPSEGMMSTSANKNNPFQCKGPPWAYERFVTTEDKMFARVDMPGVEKESVKVWVSHDFAVFFTGKAPKMWEYEEGDGRSYAGSFSLSCGCCRFVDDVQFSVENGVVQMLVSKTKTKTKI